MRVIACARIESCNNTKRWVRRLCAFSLSLVYLSFIPSVDSQPGPTSADHFLASLVVKTLYVCGVDIDRSCRYLILSYILKQRIKAITAETLPRLDLERGNGRGSTHHTIPSQVIVTSTARSKSVQSGEFQCIPDRGSISGLFLRFRVWLLLYIATRDITITKVPGHDELESKHVTSLPNRGECSS